MSSEKVALSVLDLMSIMEGRTIGDTYKKGLALAQVAEQLGYTRYWVAEHHNMESIASSAPAILIGYLAQGTATIRVGSGGVMLPNHAPLVIAEQFGTLASLYPGRIDLGLGRAPGTDPTTAHALRRNNNGADFDLEIHELMTYLSAGNKGARVRAIPGEGTEIPIWILGSSTDSALLAAALGLPYAFAAHFAPAHLYNAIRLYRQHFKPSTALKEPYVMVCVNVIAADTTPAAERIATSFYQLATGIITGKRRLLQPPIDSMDGLWTEYEEAAVRQMMAYSFVGDAARVKTGLQQFIDQTAADELMVVSHIYEPADKVASYKIVAGMGLKKQKQ